MFHAKDLLPFKNDPCTYINAEHYVVFILWRRSSLNMHIRVDGAEYMGRKKESGF